LVLSLCAACAPDLATETDAAEPAGLVVDLDGDWGPEPAVYGAARGVHLRFDLGPADLVFNHAEVPLSVAAPAGAATPFLPSPTPDVRFGLRQGGQEVAVTNVAPLQGGYRTFVVYGHPLDPRSLELPTDPTPFPGQVKMRYVHTAPGLAYAGLVTMAGSPVAGATYGAAAAPIEVAPDAQLRWAFDLNGDGRPDIPLEPFSLPATDSEGSDQVIDAYAIPTGVTLPPPVSLPVPALLLVPLDAPDGILVVRPASG
jgi:hypothetical protein